MTRRKRPSEHDGRLSSLLKGLKRPLSVTRPKWFGYVLQVAEAIVRSRGDTYPAAIAAAHARDVARLVDCLRARKPFMDADRELLAAYFAKRLRRRTAPQLVHKLMRAPTDYDFEVLAALVQAYGRRRGRPLNKWVHRVAQEVEVVERSLWGAGPIPDELRTELIERYCTLMGAENGVTIEPDQVRDLLNREKARRRKRH